MLSVLKECMACVTILKHGTIKPFFFENDQGNVLTKESYILEFEEHEDLDKEEQ